LPGLWVQDAACQSGVTPIFDRSKERLGTSDTGIARTRRFLLEALRKLTVDNQKPISVTNSEQFLWRAISISMQASSDWKIEGSEVMKAKLGQGFGYIP